MAPPNGGYMNNTVDKIKVASGYDRTESWYRNPKDIAEMISWCDSHNHITVMDIKGLARTVKVNGKVRTWKRNPSRVEVSVKYGLYEYATLDGSDLNRVLIPIQVS